MARLSGAKRQRVRPLNLVVRRHRIVASDTPSTLAATGMLIAGILGIGVGLFMALPVAVNLPDSWFGAVLAIAFVGGGIALLYGAARGFRAAKPR